MRAFLEKTENEWLDDFVYIAVEPLKNMGVEILPFNGMKGKNLRRNGIPISFEEIDFDPNDIVIGSVQATEFFFKKLGIKKMQYLGYPGELHKFLYRDTKVCAFKDVTKTVNFPFFIKPAHDIKLFTGSLCENKKQLELIPFFTPEVNNETLVLLSDPIEFLSEYRCFVHKRKLVGIKHYAGDCFRFPDIAAINQMILSYKDCPVSYTLDVGIFKSGKTYKTALVEVNDFWAIAGYGLDGQTYVRMLIDRFQEIRKS